MEATSQSQNQTGDETSSFSSSLQILNLLVSDFLQPLNNKPSTGNPIVVPAVAQAQQQQQQQHYDKIQSSGKILLTIVRNALRSHQSEPHYRKIRLGNKKIQSHVVTVPYAVDLLTAVGFVYDDENEKDDDDDDDDNATLDKHGCGGEEYLLFSENEKNVATANLFCSIMDEELKKLEQLPTFALTSSTIITEKKKNKDSNSNSNIGGGEGEGDVLLSEKERKEKSLKVKTLKAAKLAKRIEKNLAIQRWEDDKKERMERQQRQRQQQKQQQQKQQREKENDFARKKKAKAEIAITGTGTDAMEMVIAEKPDDSMDVVVEEEEEIIAAVAAATDDDRKLPATTTTTTTPKLVEEAQESLDQMTLPPEQQIHSKIQMQASSSSLSSSPLSLSWEESLKHIPRCGPAAGIHETSIFNKKGSKATAAYSSSSSSPSSSSSSSSSPTRTCLKRLFSEFEELKTSLPSDRQCSTWLRFDEETPQYIRAILTAPLPGPSPYSGGVFAFDIWIPDNYPNAAPKCEIITTGRGSVRFGPNLYACGKVCLSLLGTWEGPKWNPKKSSIFQVLVSIQSLMLGIEHPYFLEPGHGGWEEKVKEGDFASVGQTLSSGETVKEEVLKLPLHVWIYEDTIRLGTLRYAMLEPLQMVLLIKNSHDNNNDNNNNSNNPVNPALAHLLPFEDVIKLHFTHNGANVLGSVANWINASRPSTIGHAHAPLSRQQKAAQPYPTRFVNSLNTLCHQFEAQLNKLSEIKNTPSTTASSLNNRNENDSSKNHPNSAEEATKTAPIAAENDIASSTSTKSTSTTKGIIDILRQRMKEAAETGNFILAGQIQKEIQVSSEESSSFVKKVADLNAQIRQAASEGDYIRAGELQVNLKILQGKNANNDAHGSSSSSSSSSHPPPSVTAAAAAAAHMYPAEDDEEMEYDVDGYDDDGYDDDGYNDDYDGGSHNPSRTTRWGTGHKLNDDSTTAQSTKKPASTDNAPPVPRLVVKDSRKIRIRLPTSSVVTEEFDSNEKLVVVYKVVKSHMHKKGAQKQHSNLTLTPPTNKVVQLRGLSDASGKQKMELSGGAFASPYSEFGFTLLSAHPKREYSLEMDGTKALKDLDLAASATLTVMMCNARGQVKRGLLENKLAGAQGDAMDVEDLGYEALQELGEKIGVATPGDGVWKGIDQNTLESISTVLSPKQYLSQKSTGGDDNNNHNDKDPKCCICLGEFDPTEIDPQLRVLNHCSHAFHSACLQTWLSTKTNCPVCKHSLTE